MIILHASNSSEMKKTTQSNNEIPASEQQKINPISYRSSPEVRLEWYSRTKYKSKSRNPKKYKLIKKKMNLFLKIFLIHKQMIRNGKSRPNRITICIEYE